ncbi:competence protein CoiA [Virgibacillus halodenitrificans]|uniref:competence protein CoiA n=1 Tax=Virgibacillus halodenitrificans TaxID=1482 RepID=UPI000EF4AE92|nr:competence protein CoiA family protein [Virgibacillus halodenitrificans]
MLKAINSNGDAVLSFELEKSNTETYYCPHCGAELIFKNDLINIAHFSHRAKNSCSYGIGESVEHMLMKMNFYRMFKTRFPKSNIIIEDNSFYSRRADISIKGKYKNVVVEFQASKISLKEMLDRTLDYNEEGFYVLWIFHIGRTKKEGFFDQPHGYGRMPIELVYLNSIDCLHVMDDKGVIKKADLVKKWRTESFYLCNFKNIPVTKFNFNNIGDTRYSTTCSAEEITRKFLKLNLVSLGYQSEFHNEIYGFDNLFKKFTEDERKMIKEKFVG